MSVYAEKENKLVLEVTSSDKPIAIKVDGDYGTKGRVIFRHNGPKKVKSGQTLIIDTAAKLKGTTLEFTGGCENPSGGEIRIIHTLFEKDGKEIKYAFPDDYTGEPDFDETDQEPDYTFFIKFI